MDLDKKSLHDFLNNPPHWQLQTPIPEVGTKISLSNRSYQILTGFHQTNRSIVYNGIKAIADEYDKSCKNDITIKLSKIIPCTIDSIVEEVNVFKSISHPNIITFIDAGRFNEFFCFVFQPHQTTLRSIMNAPIRENMCADYMFQMLLAVNYLHNSNVYHGDIKPESFFLLEDNTLIKLGNFESVNSTQPNIGTPGYQAPETINQQQNDFSIDIWGLGCTLYEMLTGQKAFNPAQNNYAQRVAQANIDLNILRRRRISDNAINLILNMINANPAKRSKASELLDHPWFREHHVGAHSDTTYTETPTIGVSSVQDN